MIKSPTRIKNVASNDSSGDFLFPDMGNMDPRRMKAMMKQFGIKTEDISAKRVVFELEGGKRLVIENPQVSVVDMGGQKTYTVMGEAREEKREVGIPDSDVDMVAEQAKVSKEKARKALEETKGDIAEAIEKLGK